MAAPPRPEVPDGGEGKDKYPVGRGSGRVPRSVSWRHTHAGWVN